MEFISALLLWTFLAVGIYVTGTVIGWDRIWNTLLDLIGLAIEGMEKAASSMKRIFS